MEGTASHGAMREGSQTHQTEAAGDDDVWSGSFFAHQWLSGVFAYCVVAVGSAHDANRCQKTEGMGRKACSVTLQHTMYSTVLLHDWRGKKGGAVL